MSLKGDIHHIRKEIETWARGYGLDFFETIFEGDRKQHCATKYECLLDSISGRIEPKKPNPFRKTIGLRELSLPCCLS